VSTPAKLDTRLLTAGLTLTVADLVRLWAAHMPAIRPVPAFCATCGHRWNEAQPLCQTAAVVRPLLRRRRYEAGTRALSLLTELQVDDLLGSRLSTALPIEETR
jgi:hypothetical protein